MADTTASLLTTTENGAKALTAEGVAAGLMAASLRGGALTALSGQLIGPRQKGTAVGKKPVYTKGPKPKTGGIDRAALQTAMDAVIAEGESLGLVEARENIADLIVLTFEAADVLEGRGERQLFCWMFLHLYKKFPDTLLATLRHVPALTSWKLMGLLYQQSVQDAVASSPEEIALLQRLCNVISLLWARQLLLDDDKVLRHSTQASASMDVDADVAAAPKRPVSISLAAKWAPRVDSAMNRDSHLAYQLAAEVDRLRRVDISEVKKIVGHVSGEAGVEMETDEPLDLAAIVRQLDALASSSSDVSAVPAAYMPSLRSWTAAAAPAVPSTPAQNATEMYYRRLLSRLSAHLGVVEQLMAKKEWSKIEPTHVPSKANKKYMAALQNKMPGVGHSRDPEKDKGIRAGLNTKTHAMVRSTDPDRVECARRLLAAIADSKQEGARKRIKGARNQAHELVNFYLSRPIMPLPDGTWGEPREPDELVEAMWHDLVTQMKEKGTFKPGIPLSDVSGSMSGIPMEVSIALGILMAFLQPADSPWYGKLITFDAVPKWHDISACTTLCEAVRSVKNMPWGMNTDFGAAMQLILDTLLTHKVPKEQGPAQLFVFTDMQFDQAVHYGDGSAGVRRPEQVPPGEKPNPFAVGGHDVRAAFVDAGYDAPQVVFWNLRASGSPNFQADADTPGLALMSGFSQECLRQFCEGGELKSETPTAGAGEDKAKAAERNAWEVLRAKLELARYDRIRADVERLGEGRLAGYKFTPPPREEPIAGKKRKDRPT